MRFLIFGSLPPPIGGVTKSVENLCNALTSKDISYDMFSIRSLFTYSDIAHIHYNKQWKILVAIIIAKVITKKVILTYHGLDFYPDSSLVDKTILRLLDGIIVLNSKVEQSCMAVTSREKKVILLTPVFKEGFSQKTITSGKDSFVRDHEKKYLLFYAYDKIYMNGLEIYGGLFLLDLLDRLSSNYVLIFVDPQSGYKEDIKKSAFQDNIIYIDETIDFESLLQKVDLYLRPTNFDGNSVATLEAIANNVKVLASDAVDRQKGIVTYKNNNKEDFLDRLDYCIKDKSSKDAMISSIDEFLTFCRNL